jgi:cytosine/adenosine deaminase-related metal-dependent hydrolase
MYSSAARQLVYTEAGRGVESVMVDGRVVVRDRVVKASTRMPCVATS